MFGKEAEKLRKRLLERIKRLSKKYKELEPLKEFEKQEELRDKFFELLFKISFAKTPKQKQNLIKRAKLVADKIPELEGWPKGVKFWDVEAYGWTGQIPKNVRTAIKHELRKRIKPGSLNLALGSGAYPYLEESILLDYSEEMLKSVVEYKKKILYDIDKGKLPFKDNKFDSITMVFVVNYLKNPKQAIKEAKRILKKNGKLIIIQSAKPISYLYKKLEKKVWKTKEIIKLLTGFKVETDEIKVDNTKLVCIEATKQ